VYMALLALGAGRGLDAQTGLTGASLQGAVRDGSGAGLAGALVSLVEEGTGIARTTSTDAQGRYTFAALAVGTYRLRVAASGFRTWEREGLVAAVGRAMLVDVTLVLAASEAVTVHREGTADGNEGAAVAALTEGRAIDGLPANGRDFVAFSLLSPAVAAERTPPTGPTASSGLAFAGQRPRANHVMVDGFDNDDAFTGAVAAAFSQEAVREFQVLAASAPAEFGHAAGGTVNTVTKSGTNDWHGSAFFFLRDRALNAKEHFEKVDVFGNPGLEPAEGFISKGPAAVDKALVDAGNLGHVRVHGNERLIWQHKTNLAFWVLGQDFLNFQHFHSFTLIEKHSSTLVPGKEGRPGSQEPIPKRGPGDKPKVLRRDR
jgi:hypothetical protein